MNQKKKEEKVFLDLYIYTNSELDTLREYYKCTYNNLAKNRLDVENKYKVGILIESYFDRIISDDNEINQEIYDKLKNDSVCDNIKFCDVITNITLDENKKVFFRVSDKFKSNEEFNPNIASKKCSEAKEYESILFRSVISDIIITFESLLSKIYKTLILNNPFPYLKDEKIPLANFFLKDAASKISEKITFFVENKMYNSLEVLAEIFETEKIDIDKDILKSFKEIYFRRNIVIHNDAKVNKKYLDSIDPQFRKNLKIGQKIITDQYYIENALNCIYILFFYLLFGLLKKYDNKDIYLEKLTDIIFKKLQEKEYAITKLIYKKLSTDKLFTFAEKMTFRINYLNSIKQLGETEVLNNELKTLDLSIATDNFKIAQLCLEDNNSEIYNQLITTYPTSFTADEIKEWPLFINFRESQEYIKFCSEHSDDFSEEKLIKNGQD